MWKNRWTKEVFLIFIKTILIFETNLVIFYCLFNYNVSLFVNRKALLHCVLRASTSPESASPPGEEALCWWESKLKPASPLTTFPFSTVKVQSELGTPWSDSRSTETSFHVALDFCNFYFLLLQTLFAYTSAKKCVLSFLSFLRIKKTKLLAYFWIFWVVAFIFLCKLCHLVS